MDRDYKSIDRAMLQKDHTQWAKSPKNSLKECDFC